MHFYYAFLSVFPIRCRTSNESFQREKEKKRKKKVIITTEEQTCDITKSDQMQPLGWLDEWKRNFCFNRLNVFVNNGVKSHLNDSPDGNIWGIGSQLYFITAWNGWEVLRAECVSHHRKCKANVGQNIPELFLAISTYIQEFFNCNPSRSFVHHMWCSHINAQACIEMTCF